MIDDSIRKLTPSETARVQREVRQAELVARRARRKLPWLSLLTSGVLFALAVFISPWSPAVVISIWSAVIVFILLRSYLTAYFPTQRRIEQMQSALRKDTAYVTRVKADAVVELRNVDDDGPYYAFQISPNEVLFFCRDDLYADDFPNSDFEIAEVKDAAGGVATAYLHRFGQKLEPVRSLPRAAWKTLRPAHLQIVPGRLENLEEIRNPVWA